MARAAILPSAQLLGIKVKNIRGLVEKIESGFPFESFRRFQDLLHLSDRQLGEIVRISPRTLTRRKSEGRLTPEESERLLRISRLLQEATELFEGDLGSTREWLSSPNKALGGKAPLDFARTEVGTREVENLIGRLEHGVYS
ncbi:MAG: type II RES/Xre toxin-antitoxin system antitoxin [Acidobacteriota bacterium]